MDNIFAKIKRALKFFRWTFIGSVTAHLIRLTISSRYRKNHSVVSPSLMYHDKTSYFITKNIIWLLRPLAWYFKKKNIFISVNNISNAVGHVFPEIDYLYRMRVIEERFKNSKILYIYPKSLVLCGVQNIFTSKQVKVITSGVLNLFLYPLALRYPEICIDSSQGGINHQLPFDNSKPSPLPHKEVFRNRQVKYAKVRAKSSTYYPLRKKMELTKELYDFIGSTKYVVLQIKDIRVNGTFNPVNPETYEPTIEYLLEQNFGVILGGREIMPNCFHKLGVRNYSEQNFADTRNDYLLVVNSSYTISSASGFTFIPDCLDVPVLSINNWQINGYPGRRTIQIPALMNINDKKILFKDQMEEFYRLGQISPSTKTPKGWVIDDATGDDILDGFLELVSINQVESVLDMNPDQKRFNALFPFDLPHFGQSRISAKFLEKHKERF